MDMSIQEHFYRSALVQCDFQRLRNHAVPYLITIMIGPSNATVCDAYPQARAVVDDFGNLVATGGWL